MSSRRHFSRRSSSRKSKDKEENGGSLDCSAQSSSSTISTTIPEIITIEPELDEICTLTTMELHKEDPHDVITALERLCRILPQADDDFNEPEWQKLQQQFIWNGTVPTVIHTMRKFPTNESIQQLVCHWLAEFDFNCCDIQASLNIAQAGGLEATINALNAFPTSEQINQNGLALVNRLIWNLDDETPHEVFQSKAVRLVEDWYGIHTITRAMMAFPENAALQQFGCRMLVNLSKFDRFRRHLLKAHAATAVAKATENHPNDPNVTKAGNEFVKKLYRTEES